MKTQTIKDDKIQLIKQIKDIINIIINPQKKAIYQPSSYEPNTNQSIYLDYHNLIKDNIKNSNNITFILHSLSKEIFIAESIKDKIKLLNLLPEFYSPFLNNPNLNISLSHPYLSRILTVLQNNLLSNIQPSIISEIFGKIIIIIFKDEYEYKKIKKNYEISQGFCFYNMKQNEFKNQICGVLCLKSLIENTNYYNDHAKLIKSLYEKIILFIDNNNFEPKEFLIEILVIFLTKCQHHYKPYINIIFYKLLNFIETNNVILRQKIIDALAIIIRIYPYEFHSIESSLINFLSILSKDKDEYIRKKSNQILNEFKNACNLNTYSANTFYDKNYSTMSKSTCCALSTKYIKDLKLINDYKYKNKIYTINNNNNKHRKNSARTLNINYYRNHYKIMKENNNINNNEKNFSKSIDGNKKSLVFNLNRLKNDINNMGSSLNEHIGEMEKKFFYRNLHF